MGRHLSLPRRVSLRPSRDRLAPCAQVYDALHMSKQRIYALRKTHGFPASEGRHVDTQAVAKWLVAHGVEVHWS